MNRRRFIKNAAGIFIPAIVGLTPKAASIIQINPQIRTVTGGAAPSYLMSEDCEGTGTPAGWTNAGSPEWDYTGTVLEGSQSLRINGVGEETYYALSSIAEVWTFFVCQWGTLGAGDYFASIQDTGGTRLSGIRCHADGHLQLVNFASNTQVTAASFVTTGTKYYFWHHYKNNGANSDSHVYVSTTTTKPGSPTLRYSVATGDAAGSTSNAVRIAFENDASATMATIFDHMRADDADIGSNPS